MTKKRVLTGINTTGTLHIGNYVGAIRPAIQDSRDPNVESFFFLADLHALIKCQDPADCRDLARRRPRSGTRHALPSERHP